MIPPFLILALPRSRTAWLSKFLTYRPWVCGHDQLRYMRGLDDIRSWFMQPYIGSAETLAPAFWRLIPRYAPGCRVLVVRRPVQDVLESVKRQGIVGQDLPRLMKTLLYSNAKLDQIEQRLPNTISVNFDELSDPEICRIVFEHCTTQVFDYQWWQYWNGINVQVNFDAMMRYTWAHLVQLSKLAHTARHQMMVDIQRPAKIPDGLEIQEEPFETSFRDAQDLFASHCLALGQPADEWTKANAALMEAMDATGCLQILTARANGRMFGYLVSILGPTTDSATERSATHTLFFASKEWPGAGLRLQREAIQRLKNKGFAEVVMRSWLGPGAKIESLYKRIGAELDGQLYRIRLES